MKLKFLRYSTIKFYTLYILSSFAHNSQNIVLLQSSGEKSVSKVLSLTGTSVSNIFGTLDSASHSNKRKHYAFKSVMSTDLC